MCRRERRERKTARKKYEIFRLGLVLRTKVTNKSFHIFFSSTIHRYSAICVRQVPAAALAFGI